MPTGRGMHDAAASPSPSPVLASAGAGGTALVRITIVGGTPVPEHAYVCTVELGGWIVGKFYAASWAACVERAHDYLDPDDVKWLRIQPNAVDAENARRRAS